MLLQRAAARSQAVQLISCCSKAAMTAVACQSEVQCSQFNGLGRITLARSKQLNALGAEHVEQIQQQLLAWADKSSGIKAVLLDSDNDRSFCSGGDVKAARQAVLDNPYTAFPPEGHHIHRVFHAEYSTLLLVANYKVPLVSLCQGIWMGLGFGLAGFGQYRVVSDGTVFAMPENAIGLWPDVGFAYKAAHMPGHLGLFLGLTGVRLSSPSDLLYTGLATHYIPQDQLQAFRHELAQSPSALQALLQQYSRSHPDSPGPLQRLQPVIDKHMDHLITHWRHKGCDAVDMLQSALQRVQQELAAIHDSDHQAALLLQSAINGWAYGSPRSLVLTLKHITSVCDAVHGSQPDHGAPAGDSQAHLATLPGVMHLEYCMAVRQVAHEDFIEGVRAALVDKDRRPAWLVASNPQHMTAGADGKLEGAKHHGPSTGHTLLAGNRFSVQQLFQPLPGRYARGQHLLL